MRTRLRLAAAALALVTPFGVVACGGGEGGEDGQEQEVEQEDDD